MKVLLLSPLPPPEGGIATWTVKYMQYCERNSLDVSVVNIALTGKRGERINAKKNVLDEVERTVKIVRELKSQLNSFSPDVIHLNTSCSKFGIMRDYLCCVIAKRRRIPVILQCHCNITSQIKNKLSVYIFKKMIKQAKKVLTLNSLSEKYVDSLQLCKAVTVPNFIDAQMIEHKHIVRDTLKEILFVGHVQRAKGCAEILEAANKLSQYHFTLVGPVSKEIAEIKCPDNVTLTGAKKAEDVREYLKNSDVFLFPSYTEGFSLALTEAMSAGLPVVATDVGANKDMLEGKGGIIIPVKDSGAIIEAFERITDKDIREKMSNWNREKVRNNYMLDTVMERLWNIYEEAVDTKKKV